MDIGWNNNYINSQKDILDEHHREGEYTSESEFDEDPDELRGNEPIIGSNNESSSQMSYFNMDNSKNN